MWHEARKQERKIRGIMVDYKKRAERRREFYEKIKQDPTQFLRIHATPCKINLDPAVAVAAEGPGTMMPWQGDSTNMIDRFDARAHLDIIPKVSVVDTVTKNADKGREEHKCNYERYRTLVQNECAGISEEQCLQQITTDEMFPEIGLAKKANEAKAKLMGKKAAIGFIYEESTPADDDKDGATEERGLFDSDSDSSDSLSDIDIDINVDVDELDEEQRVDMNECAEKYGMAPGEYVRMLEKDKEEIEMLKRAKEEEEEKAMYSGRKSRRERRAFIEKKLRERRDIAPSPPSYARRNSPTYQPYSRRSETRSSSRSRSTTPEDTGRVTFITSFGEEEAAAANAALSSSKKSSELQSWKTSSQKRSRSNSSSSSFSSKSRSRSRSKDRSNSSSSSSSSRSLSRERQRRQFDLGGQLEQSRSRSSSSRSSSKSPVRTRYNKRSRSRSRERHGRDSRSRSRSPRRTTRPWSPGHHGRRSRSKSPERLAGSRGSQYSINAKLKKPEMGLSKAVVSVSADKPKLTPQQKLKLRMQKALTKQHKADKVKEVEKKAEKRHERQTREEDLREMSRKMRRREREKREQEREKEYERERSRYDRSRSRSSSPERRRKYSRRYSRSRSRSRSRSSTRSRSCTPPPRSRYHRD